MRINLHGTQAASTAHEGEMIGAEVQDREGNSVNLFFDCVDDVERLAEELAILARGIREQEPKDFCAETGEVLV